MKLVLAVVQNQDVGPVLERLLEKGLRATKLASTGGFLRQGNTTLLIGVENERVAEVVDILRNTCEVRRAGGQGSGSKSKSVGAIVFVLNVSRFDRI